MIYSYIFFLQISSIKKPLSNRTASGFCINTRLLYSNMALSKALPPYDLLIYVIRPSGEISTNNCNVKVDL